MAKIRYVQVTVLLIFLVFTVASGVNNYNSGVYADAHSLDGGKVGWFQPFGVLVFALALLITLGLGVYIVSRAHKK